jgi:peptidylprolyl isomerase
MSQAKSGDTVRVHYSGRLQDGQEFDSSEGREPLEFTIGTGQIVPGVEEAVVGMNLGDERTVTVAADDAYGQRREDMVQQIERSMLPEGMEPQIGMRLAAEGPGGSSLMLTVVDLDETSITVDANHPLAGHDLTFDLKLVEIV